MRSKPYLLWRLFINHRCKLINTINNLWHIYAVLGQRHCGFIFKRSLSNQVRVRFAPSPTGYLHLGGLRTALYNHLFAKSHNGTTILRIEDTDLSRKVPSAAEDLIEDLAWCGITYDEGPYFQSERKEIYQKYAKQLLDQGDAYYCFCSSERLLLLRKESLRAGEIPKYDNHCRHLTKDELESCLEKTPPCIRFKLSNFKDTYNDLICGPTSHNPALEGDPVILKTDGFPTYHLANVVDDHLMNITHILRGMEWLTSTPKHILLYRAFKWDPPHFGHFPLLMNADGKKLSKRQNDIQIRNLRKEGYLPNSLINFVIHFGGGFDIKSEKKLKVYTMEELADKFDISEISHSSCKVDFKLLPAYNHIELCRQLEAHNSKEALVKKTQEIIQNRFPDSEYNNKLFLSDEHVDLILKTTKHRISSLNDLIKEEYYYLWVWENKWSKENEIYNEFLKNLIEKIKTVKWTQEELHEFLKSFCKQNNKFKYSDLMQVIRLALTGKKVGHGVPEIMSLLSRENVLFRLSKVIEPQVKSVSSTN